VVDLLVRAHLWKFDVELNPDVVRSRQVYALGAQRPSAKYVNLSDSKIKIFFSPHRDPRPPSLRLHPADTTYLQYSLRSMRVTARPANIPLHLRFPD
jgi:hypothetical protein